MPASSSMQDRGRLPRSFKRVAKHGIWILIAVSDRRCLDLLLRPMRHAGGGLQ